jgi:hypothetical protein
MTDYCVHKKSPYREAVCIAAYLKMLYIFSSLDIGNAYGVLKGLGQEIELKYFDKNLYLYRS